MFINAFVAFLHFLAAFGVFATVFYEWLTFSRTPTHAEALRLQGCDMLYGISASVLLAAGLLRVFYFEKGSAFYFSNHFFLTKVALFLLVGLLSIYPTIRFLSWRTDTKAGKAPVITDKEYSAIRLILRLEVTLLVAILFCASMMAKGIGS